MQDSFKNREQTFILPVSAPEMPFLQSTWDMNDLSLFLTLAWPCLWFPI